MKEEARAEKEIIHRNRMKTNVEAPVVSWIRLAEVYQTDSITILFNQLHSKWLPTTYI